MDWDVDQLLDNLLAGNEESAVDDKGRISIGKDNRDVLGENFFMGLDKEGTLVIYPRSTVRDILLAIRNAPVLDEGREQYTQLWASQLERNNNCDKQGRVTIPARLRRDAKINQRVKLEGALDRILVWPMEEWEERFQATAKKGDARLAAMRDAYKKMTEASKNQ
jgi:MraZ protein